ncbi:MAG: ATP-binding protein [Bacteroidales bacterium]|nr:ATP-binding protein [Bacteroidales bacterium]
MNLIKSFIVTIVLLFSCAYASAFAQEDVNDTRILVISSYNPDAARIYATLTEFTKEYAELGGNATVDIENMNCKSNSEFLQWRGRMKEILANYFENVGHPDFVLLLGQEAFTAYLSQDEKLVGGIPVLAGNVSYNVVLIPRDTLINPCDWMPHYVDVRNSQLFPDLKGGFVYSYDLRKNVELIMSLYPETQNIAFLSDNSYGGVTMQAFVREEMHKHYPDMKLILLDGRSTSFFEMQDKLSGLPEHTAIIIGTWRIDKNERFFFTDDLFSMRSIVPDIPVFSISSTGIGQWAIGGYIPKYVNYGKELAQQIVKLSDNLNQDLLVTIDHEYLFDYNVLINKDIKHSSLPKDSRIINEPVSFFAQNKLAVFIVSVVILLLLVMLFLSLLVTRRTAKFNAILKQREKELVEAKKNAEESNRLKSAFLADMSHEIRTPLNAIVGFSEVLMETDDPEEKKTCINIINSNNSLLLQLVGDILDLSKIEANTIDFKDEEFDLNTLFEEQRASFAMKVAKAEKPIDIVFEKSYDNVFINSDRDRINQVLTKFLANALKFTDYGSITMGYEKIGDGLRCYVKDTGCGIPSDKLDEVFERFVKLDTFKAGTGLGLSICKTIISKLGGTIGVDSVLGKGSTFWFILPSAIVTQKANDNSLEKKGQAGSDNPVVVPSTEKEPHTAVLLVAEDNEDNYLLYEVSLKNKYKLIRAKNGVEAINLFEKWHNSISAVLMDIKMPLMDGYQAAELIRKEDNAVPIIAITAYVYENEKQNIKKHVFNDYIVKPIAAGALESVLDQYIKE